MWQRSPRVTYEIIEGLAVLIDPDGVELITLNDLGTRVWEELDGRRDATQLAEKLAEVSAGVTIEVLERDIIEFVAELERGGLVVEGDAAD